MFSTCVVNAHSLFWWPNGDTTNEGTDIDEIFTKLGLSEVISSRKTEVFFSCENNVQNHPEIIFHGTVVAKVEEKEPLGFIFESNLSSEKLMREKLKRLKKYWYN